MKAAGVIPSRYASTRFPGKPLAKLPDGRTMIAHVIEQVQSAKLLSEVIVATDDERIAAEVRACGCVVAMTSPDCATGSDRIAEVARDKKWDIVVNVQGDEPYIDPGVIDLVTQALIDAPECGVSTAMTPIRMEGDFLSPHVVKAVAAPDGRALYFSRSPIPSPARLKPEEMRAKDFVWGMKHLGLYAYRKEVLMNYTKWPQTPLERRESLEQLRLMENGIGIRLVEVEHDSIGIDTPEELTKLFVTASTKY